MSRVNQKKISSFPLSFPPGPEVGDAAFTGNSRNSTFERLILRILKLPHTCQNDYHT